MPTSDALTAITDDIYQVRLPLPFALRIVNCYLLRGRDGWTIVDTGLNTPGARAVWQAVCHELEIGPGHIEQIVLTHSHPDHYGMAGWMQTVCQRDAGTLPPVRLSAREAELVAAMWDPQSEWRASMMDFWRQCGVPAELATAVVDATDRTRRATFPPPQHMQTIQPGGTLRLGDRQFHVLHMPGHSDGQIIFYDPGDRLLLCGDHVLLGITPNISLWPSGEPDPLGRYLGTFERLAALDVGLALPGHRAVILDLPQRLAELRHHHDERLAHTAATVAPDATVYDIARQIFNFTHFTVHEARFAVAETLAHLEYLATRGHLTRHVRDEIWRYAAG